MLPNQLQTAHRTRQNELEQQQSKLLDAHLAGAVPIELMRKKQTSLELDLQHIRSRFETFHKDYSDAKKHLGDCLGLLANCHAIYRNSDDSNRRLCNQAFFERIYIDADGEVQTDLARPFTILASPASRTEQAQALQRKADANKPPRNLFAGGSNISPRVDAGGLKPNTWQRFERLGAAWNQAKLGGSEEPCGDTGDEPGVVANPRRRARTPLTPSEVDSIRTLRAAGVSVSQLAKEFGVHRATIWERTREF